MRFIIVFLALFFTTPSFCQDYDTIFYGINGKIEKNIEKSLAFKVVKRKKKGKNVVTSYARTLDGWAPIRVEKSGKSKDNCQVVWYREGTFLGKNFKRELKMINPGQYYFKEYKREIIIRTGSSRDANLFILDGKVSTYYPNGITASISHYDRNILLSNQNWNSDSTPYIDNIFYSADKPPIYPQGGKYINNFLLSRIAEENFPVHEINDDILLSWVIMETGELTGVRVLKGKIKSVNDFFKSSMELLPGTWEAAELDGRKVRYLITMPISLNNDVPLLNYVELTPGGQLFWSQ